MRTADTVLGIIRARGTHGQPLDDVYRQLYNPALYLRAYHRIARNKGALTPGVTPETVDGMSRAKIEAIIETLRQERYRWTPVRRVYIAKKHSAKQRPLGLPTWSDKLLQEVVRSILEAYYEPQFSRLSHGFRPDRGCHTALGEVQRWQGTVWFIEGDISQCFDRLDHGVLLSILREKILDQRFLRLIENLLKVGYLEEWKFHRTLSGSPQGGVVSPILANIYLDRLDQFVEDTLLPAGNRGAKRQPDPTYMQLTMRAAYLRRCGRQEEAMALRKQAQHLRSKAANDPEFRRLRYVRYADDFLLGFIGPRHEAEGIKDQLGKFLREQLKLELSEAKTLLTHASSDAARFLGYEVSTLRSDSKYDQTRRRSVNGRIALRVPESLIRAKCSLYIRNGNPACLVERCNDSVFSIVALFQQEYRGLVEYYRMALNLHRMNYLKWWMEQSLVHTLSRKLRITVSAVYARYGGTMRTLQGTYKVLRVVTERDGNRKPLEAYWGAISLRRRVFAHINDQPGRIWNVRSELLARLLADSCELCGSQERVEVHHIRHLKDLKRPGRAPKSAWVEMMAARRRKTLVVCQHCHDGVHANTPTRDPRHRRAG
jgi:group II intron reverse transcriptase/maturase